MKNLFQQNCMKLFYDPRRWRLSPRDIESLKVQFLNFSPPQYDFLVTVTLTTPNRDLSQTLFFYEGVLAKKTVDDGERVYGRVRVGEANVHFVEGYSSREYVAHLLEEWCRSEKLGSLGFTGRVLGVKGQAHFMVEALNSLAKPGEEVTSNYLYRCRGWAETSKRKLKFDLVIKRFLPREPPDRGNREYALIRILPREIVPRVYGGLVNTKFKVGGERQLLVLFMDYIEGVEVGKQIWDVMEQVSRKKGSGENHEAELKLLESTVEKAIDNVVFPLHKSGFEAWYSSGAPVKARDEYQKWYFRELEQNLAAMKEAKLVNAQTRNSLLKTFRGAWQKILQSVKATEIHGDLMWRQIMKTKDGKLIILDLDEHVMGHMGKDIADLCAANRFISEDLPSQDKEYMRTIAEKLNQLILECYLKNAERAKAVWAENIEKTVLAYLAYRHLHDAAYYAPAWRHARNSEDRNKYKRYVDLSLNWLDKSLKNLEAALEE